MANLFNSKFSTVYGPGAAKPPAYSSFPKSAPKPKPAPKAPQAKPKWTVNYSYQDMVEKFLGKEYVNYQSSYIDQVFQQSKGLAYMMGQSGATDFNTGYYAEVGKALGFTTNEIAWLVQANDKGLSFATIAALIEEHPPVLSSALTASRKAEEAAFCKNVEAAIDHARSISVPPNPKPKPSKSYFDMTAWQNDDNPYEGISKAITNSPNAAWYAGDDYLPVAAPSWKNIMNKMDALTFTKPKYGLIIPKSGEYAKMLGIWLPS